MLTAELLSTHHMEWLLLILFLIIVGVIVILFFGNFRSQKTTRYQRKFVIAVLINLTCFMNLGLAV